MIRIGSVLRHRFRIEEQARAGGMGQIFRATDLSTGKSVAAKILLDTSPQHRARFQRETEILERIHHPHVVEYVGSGVSPDGEAFIVMEWLEGEDLLSVLTRRRLSVQEALSVSMRIASAMGAVHAQGVVHRDLKPANIFLVDGNLDQPKILDFGIAYVSDATRVTAAGTVVGTPSYMAPEQARSGGKVEATADVFSLGCLLFECLTGEPPFVAEHLVAVLAKVVFEEALRASELAPDVPDWLDRLIERMLAKDPALRPQDGAEVARLLEAATMPIGSEGERIDEPIGRDERRFLGVVLVGKPPTIQQDATVTITMDMPAPFDVKVVIERFGAHHELFADGTTVVIFDQTSIPTDIATQVARCALALRTHVPEAPIAIATGWGELGRGLPVGDAIERAVQLLYTPREDDIETEHRIFIDDTTAGLLDARFDVIDLDEHGFELRGERDVFDTSRPLLGKVTACVGRERELAMLDQALTNVISEPAAFAVVISGPAGIGKSRLLQAFVERNRQAGKPLAIWIGRGDPERAGSTYGLLADALQRAAGITPGASMDVRREKFAAFVSRFVEEDEQRRVTEFLGELAGVPFPDEDSLPLRAARQDPELCGEQMKLALHDFLRAVCARRPLLLVLDDVQFGDHASVAAVGAALRDLADEPILLVGTARPEIDQVFPNLWADNGRQLMTLGPISPKASARLVRQVLGESVEASLVERLVSLADGHPFFLEELVRTASEDRGGAMPSTVVAMVQTRLERLEPLERRALRAASVLGDVFWRSIVSQMVGADLTNTWSMLVKNEICVRHRESRFAGDEEYAFRQALLREGAYGLLTEKDRELGHRLAGDLLERAGETNPLILAGHFERGGLGARAAQYYIRGAELASARRDDLDAERWYSRALELLGSLPISAQRGRGLARFRLNQHAEAVEVLHAAAQQAAVEGDTLAQIELLLDEAMVLDWLSEYRKGEERVLEAKALKLERPSPLIDARLLLGLGRSSVRSSRQEQAAEELVRAADAAANLGEEGHETRVIALLMLGFLLPSLGRLEEAASVLDEVIRSCEERVDLLHIGPAFSNRALVRGYRGDREGAIADFEQSIALGRKLGQPQAEFIAHFNLTEYLYFLDDLETAEFHLAAVIALASKPATASLLHVVLMLQARMKLYRGHADESRRIMGQVRHLQTVARESHNGHELLSPSDDVLAAMIETATSDATDAQWDDIEARSAMYSFGQEQIEVLEARARWAMRNGRHDEAKRRFERALDLSTRVLTVMIPRLQRGLASLSQTMTNVTIVAAS
ncbi:MAG: protein kinase [Polyangiaceae bacterium]|nr:protein kinase [Polyangiaceae bacterium]